MGAAALALAALAGLGFTRALSTTSAQNVETGGLASAPPAAPAPAPAADRDADPRRLIPFGALAPVAAPPGTLRIATFNVENLFDDQDDPALSGEQDDKTMTKPAEQREAVAKAIRDVNADVVAMQEVESEAALKWFVENHLKDAGYTHIASIDSGDGRGIECSIISKFPISDTEVWPLLPLGGTHPQRWGNEENREAGKPILFRRSPLRGTITVPAAEVAKRLEAAGQKGAKVEDFKVTLFVVHQKSGGPGGYWREREAAKTTELYGQFASKNPGQPVLILGDMNTQPGSKPIETYLQAGLKDLFDDRVQGKPEWITHASGRVIDFVIGNDEAAKRVVKESRFILGLPQRPRGSDWRTTPAPAGYGSDHLPVVVDLKLGG
jgi:endonuclease/exonuclease/phosphatase family metal-dependent hydrolase